MMNTTFLKCPFLAFGLLTIGFWTMPRLAEAQSFNYPSNASVSVGFSAIGVLVSLLDFDETFDVSSSATPAFQATYDRAVLNWLSLGAGVSFQRLSLDINNYTYESFDEQGFPTTVTENVTSDYNRLNVAIRPLFHYGKDDKLDMYSGLRLGLTFWSGEVKTTDPDFDSFDFSGVNPTFQVIPFGLRGYPHPNLGIGFETGVGSPHFFNINANYRF